MVAHIAVRHGIEAKSALLSKGAVEIHSEAVGPEAVEIRPKGREGFARRRHFGHSVNHATAAAPPKEQRIRTAQDFHAL